VPVGSICLGQRRLRATWVQRLWRQREYEYVIAVGIVRGWGRIAAKPQDAKTGASLRYAPATRTPKAACIAARVAAKKNEFPGCSLTETSVADFLRVEDLKVYQKLCQLHIEMCELTQTWPATEKYELASQIRRSSNSPPANLAEKHSDRHIRNKIEGVNRSRGEALETIHHLYIAKLKAYIDDRQYNAYRSRYLECVRMLNGLEKTLERQTGASPRRWPADAEVEDQSPDD
jgi:four helix bundle protein